MPDDSTAVLDPFTEEPTLILVCDVIEPSTMQGYDREAVGNGSVVYAVLPLALAVSKLASRIQQPTRTWPSLPW